MDIVRRKALHFEGPKGETVTQHPVPESLVAAMEAKRIELIERVAEVDEARVGFRFPGGTQPRGALAGAAADGAGAREAARCVCVWFACFCAAVALPEQRAGTRTRVTKP